MYVIIALTTNEWDEEMIKRKIKFTQSIDFNEAELGGRNKLMQDARDLREARGKPKSTHKDENKIPSLRAPDALEATSANSKDIEIHQANTEVYKAKVEDVKSLRQTEVAYDLNEKTYKAALDHNQKDFEARKAEANAKVKIAQIQQDPNEISQTEMEVFKLVKKYDLFNSPDAFKNMGKVDAYQLEDDLKKLGANLKVDGIVNETTVNAVEALISKNAPAIKAYKEVTGIDLLRPNKPQIER